MSPRSILKRSTPSQGSQTHAVHFPPSPSLCRTFAAHPPTIYDRTPIVVSKNSCALPERGCPGRTYVLEEHSQRTAAFRSYHPRPINTSTSSYRPVDSEHRSLADLPQLVPDLSSESDESDGFVPSPQMPPHLYSYGAHGLPAKYDSGNSSYFDYPPSNAKDGINALAFLPYPPSPPANYNCSSDESQASKPRKKRSESRRRHDGASEPDRIPTSSRRREYLASQYSGFGARDDGCLGGF
ncbi:hypothetical protein D9611_000983 [Ephemerocybe angulata]|uniref:Uncharacterized protein n=1 Tax=Ephemerocybe angulata TaxID=980116 RepID=A0A8H5BQ45_9AGAR|nr:hypothetical protein D9611_000983 [Tulosesus angulatus]